MKYHHCAFRICSFFYALIFCTIHYSGMAQRPSNSPKESLAVLKNEACQLTIDLYGGAFSNFLNASSSINPLSWSLTKAQMPKNNQKGAPFKGHFLCLGRWGSPSEGEIKAGIPHNGEPTNSMWTVKNQTSLNLHMTNTAPLDGLGIERYVELYPKDPVFLVKEIITNTFSLSRPNNIVQHVTIGPPFLTASVVTQTNAGKGFNQKFSYPDPHQWAYDWPKGRMDTLGTIIDLKATSTKHNYVSTHIFPEGITYGWITAFNPEEGLLLGYVWKIEEYPWLNVWNHQVEGKPVAKGLEFGTTGIGQPYKALLEVDTRFYGHHSFEYIDAGEIKEKSFVGFLIKIKGKESPELSITEEEIQVWLGDKKVRSFKNKLSN